MRHSLADGTQLGERRLHQLAVLFDPLLAAFGNPVELLSAARLDFGQAGFFEIGEGGVDDARARHIEAAGALFQGLDQFIAMARLLGKQSEDDELQIGGVELPTGAKPAAEHAALEASHELSPMPAAGIAAFAMS